MPNNTNFKEIAFFEMSRPKGSLRNYKDGPLVKE